MKNLAFMFSSGTLWYIQQNVSTEFLKKTTQKNKNKIKHKKKGTSVTGITFEKLSELQSETVAIATLYQ